MKFLKEAFATQEQLKEAIIDGGSLKGFKPAELLAIFQALTDKGISFAQLPDYQFQIQKGKDFGMDFDTLLAYIKSSMNADELGGIVYDFEQNGNNQLRKSVVGESMNESIRKSVVIEPYEMQSCPLEEGDEIELSRDLIYTGLSEASDWYYDEKLSREEVIERIKSDYNMIVKEIDGIEYACIAKGTILKLVKRFGPGGGYPEFQVNGKETLDFAGDAFRAYKITNDLTDLENERTFSLTQYQIRDLQRYVNKYEYSWDEVYDAINAKVKRENMSVEDAIDEVEEDMVAGKSSLYESNQLKDLADDHKKKQKGNSPFTKLDAGDVEKGSKMFNHAMGSDNCDGGECMGEDVSPTQINVREALNDIDKMIENPCFVTLYDSCKLTEEEKLKVANMIVSDKYDLNSIYEYLLTKSEE